MRSCDRADVTAGSSFQSESGDFSTVNFLLPPVETSPAIPTCEIFAQLPAGDPFLGTSSDALCSPVDSPSAFVDAFKDQRESVSDVPFRPALGCSSLPPIDSVSPGHVSTDTPIGDISPRQPVNQTPPSFDNLSAFQYAVESQTQDAFTLPLSSINCQSPLHQYPPSTLESTLPTPISPTTPSISTQIDFIRQSLASLHPLSRRGSSNSHAAILSPPHTQLILQTPPQLKDEPTAMDVDQGFPQLSPETTKKIKKRVSFDKSVVGGKEKVKAKDVSRRASLDLSALSGKGKGKEVMSSMSKDDRRKASASLLSPSSTLATYPC